MLVLSRKKHETIKLGNDIVLTIVQVQGNKVRIGIDAPPNVQVVRGELETKTITPEAVSGCN